MVVHLGTQLQINFGYIVDGNITQRYPFQVEILDYSEATLKHLVDTINQARKQIEQEHNNKTGE